jgi:hypothetical protein
MKWILLSWDWFKMNSSVAQDIQGFAFARRSQRRICDNDHNLAMPTTISWPRMPVLTQADWLMRGLCNHNVAESPDFQA